jgi:hypothetical protein
MNFSEPHGVLLFFERGPQWSPDCLTEHRHYYNQLGNRLLQYALPAVEGAVFISLSVHSDAELETLLAHDPALQNESLAIIKAIALTR